MIWEPSLDRVRISQLLSQVEEKNTGVGQQTMEILLTDIRREQLGVLFVRRSFTSFTLCMPCGQSVTGLQSAAANDDFSNRRFRRDDVTDVSLDNRVS
jgi:uncharacterized protein (DUF1786 family)